jgi:hypothetical protein
MDAFERSGRGGEKIHLMEKKMALDREGQICGSPRAADE